MKTNQYILATDILKLTDAEYESFRNYLRLLGYVVLDTHGGKYSVTGYGNEYALTLGKFFSKNYYLRWTRLKILSGYERLSLYDIKIMAKLGMIV